MRNSTSLWSLNIESHKLMPAYKMFLTPENQVMCGCHQLLNTDSLLFIPHAGFFLACIIQILNILPFSDFLISFISLLTSSPCPSLPPSLHHQSLGFTGNLVSNPECWLRIKSAEQGLVVLLSCCCDPGAEPPTPPPRGCTQHDRCQTIIWIHVRTVPHTMQMCLTMACIYLSILPSCQPRLCPVEASPLYFFIYLLWIREQQNIQWIY